MLNLTVPTARQAHVTRHVSVDIVNMGARMRARVQGEADATKDAGLQKAQAWGAAFSAFVHALRTDLKGSYHTRLPVIMGIMQNENRCDRWGAALRLLHPCIHARAQGKRHVLMY